MCERAVSATVFCYCVPRDETLACFPEMAAAVENALCRVDHQTSLDVLYSGIGEGTVVYDQAVLTDKVYSLDPERAARWREKHCTDQGPLIDLDDGLPLWSKAYAKTPSDLLWPWQACMRMNRKFWQLDNTRFLVCTVIPSDGEEVTFGARWFSDVWLDLRVSLHEDLAVEGATCWEPWEAGSMVPFKGREITCQRIPGEQTVFRVNAGEYSCEVAIPPEPAVSWQEKCAAGAER